MSWLPSARLRPALRSVLLAALLVLTGCHIPAIDPTGQRIFTGGHTSLAHHWRDTQVAVPFGPAIAPVKPPCTPPVAVVPVVPQPVAIPITPVGCGPKQQAVQTPLPAVPTQAGPACAAAKDPPGPVLCVTPSRIVAPINSEVILAAGVCDKQGYYVMRQPLEWMLAQDGVGQFVAVGHESRHHTSYLLRDSPQKVATNYVRAHTSNISQTIDRGTKSPADDVQLVKGQSWVTVTSPTEGTSHVVVWAPKEHNWERRKSTATIYWVDAVWLFPPPTSARVGERKTLTTVVTRAGGTPIAGWIVRYEVVGGPEAVFSARGETAVEVQTDFAGQATVEVLPRSTMPGITTFRVQVIRPAAVRGDLPQMVVGQGQTSVAWSTPGLAVAAVGTSNVTADGAISYRVDVTNNGDLPTRGVVLSFTPPAGVTLLNSNPPAQVFGQRYEWRLGDLPARTASVVELNCRAGVAADVRSRFEARATGGLVAEAVATTRVFANAVQVKMTGPDAVEVGKEAKFLIDITNTGSGTLTNILASDSYDPGLAHLQGEPSPIRRALDRQLGPGETYRMAVSFIVRQPGRHCHRLDVTADGGHAAAARGCVTGTQPAQPVATPPQLTVRVTGPGTKRAGEVADFFIEVVNAGTAAATNVVIQTQYGVNLQFKEGSGQGRTDDPRRLSIEWRVPQIAGGERVVKQLNCLCLQPDETNAFVRATVASDQMAAQSAEKRIVIAPGAAPPIERPPVERPMTERVPSQPPVTGNLKVTIADLSDPIKLGATTTYTIEVVNERNVSDRDVTVTLQLSDGLKVTGARGPTAVASSTPDGRTVELTPIAELRAGERPDAWRIEVTGTRMGKQTARVTVRSSRSPAGVSATAETTVNAP